MWNTEEDDLLHRLCDKYPNNWAEIAKNMPGRNAI